MTKSALFTEVTQWFTFLFSGLVGRQEGYLGCKKRDVGYDDFTAALHVV